MVHHTGPVRTIDFNPFQPNLLASGANESEIFIWDLNNPDSPMSPGNKLHPLEDISGVAWNRQVQHIIASTSPSGKSVLWDLRKNEPIIQIADPNARVHCNAISWHPDVATQMVTASGDDRSPVIQLWDLRFATSPMRTLERHKKGILSLAWCPQDSDLLLSAAKDNLVLCWNPNSDIPGGEVVYELPATSQWIFEVHWCPRNPSMISTASFDGHVTMYSLLGGGVSAHEEPAEQPVQQSDDPFANLAPKPHQQPVETTPLKKPPKWFRRPCGARFSFGGKLVSFCHDNSRSVHVSQVVTEEALLTRSSSLEAAVAEQDFSNFCADKASHSTNTSEQNIWNFLKVTFEPDTRRQYLRLLGYDTEELDQKLSRFRSGAIATGLEAGPIDPSDLSQRLSSLPLEGEEEEGESAPIFGASEDDTGGDSVFDNITSQDQPHKPTSSHKKPLSIATTEDVDGALSKALLVGNFEAAVDICIGDGRMAEAMVLAVAGGADLLQKTQQTLFQQQETQISRLMSAIVNRDWTQLVRVCCLDNWREVLAALVTYAGPDEFSSLCDLLGERLECEDEGRYRDNANLCYICSGNVDKFVECWNQTARGSYVSGVALQDLMEKVVLLKRAVERERKQLTSTTSTVVAEKFRAYAGILASQGSLATALRYLELSGTSEENALLQDRLFQAQGGRPGPGSKPPFQTVDVQPPRVESVRDQTRPAPHSNGPHSVPNTGAATTTVSNPYQRTQPGHSMPSYTPYNPAGQPNYPTGQPVFQPGPTNFQNPPTAGNVGAVPPSYPTANPPSTSQPVAIFNPINTQQPVSGTGLTSAPPPSIPVSKAAITNAPTARVTAVSSNPLSQNSPLPAWNDPPTFAAKNKPSVPAPTPITAPVMTPLGETPIAGQQSPPMSGATATYRQSSPAPTQPPAPQVIEKPPIPPEHQQMVAAFESILAHCRTAASTTAHKRKTEDISKKLATLCDLLRESRV
jgi:protein transport protein SEC31